MKHISTAWLLAVLLSCFFSKQTTGQSLPQFTRHVIPPSPEATQLGVFGSLPPDLNTGAVQTTIPLVTITSQQLSLPITLNYHYTGLMVNEVASWAGLGWTVSAGGVITRTVQGLPDEWYNGGYTSPSTWPKARLIRNRVLSSGRLAVDMNYGSSSADRNLSEACEAVMTGALDTEADAYSVSTPFYSGKLFLDSTGVITCSPYTDVRFSGDPVSGWTATTGDGTVYLYRSTEAAHSTEEVGTGHNPATAWYLTSIQSADGKDWMDFAYAAIDSTNAVPASTLVRKLYQQLPDNQTDCNTSSSQYTSVPDPTTGSVVPNNIFRRTLYLVGINTPTTETIFHSDRLRQDIGGFNDRPAPRLTGITYRSWLTNSVRTEFVFAYRYFNPTSSDPQAKRLQLAAVREVGKPAYLFTYDTTGQGHYTMPSREKPTGGAYARDHWGYYNGRNANTTLLPTFSPAKATQYNISSATNAALAIRTPNGAASRLGALTQIRYPTGGWTKFEYEPNSIVVCDLAAEAANQFGGSPTSSGTEPFSAQATGSSRGNNLPPVPFAMDTFELAYSQAHDPRNVGSGDGTGTNTAPQNVRATRIDAPYGFFLSAVRYDGIASQVGPVISTGNAPRYQCVPANKNIDAYLYKYDAGTLELLPQCDVQYPPQSQSTTTGQCITMKNGSACDALRGRNFPPGIYYLVAEVNSADPDTFFASIGVDIIRNTAPTQPSGGGSGTTGPCLVPMEVGGIRLVRTRDFGGTGDTLVKTYRYRKTAAEGGGSSGVVFFQPQYSYETRCTKIVLGAFDLGKANWLDVGYHIGYGRVEVESKGKKAGTTVYTYLNDNRWGANNRGAVTKVEELDQAGALVKETTNEYNWVLINSSPSFNLALEYTTIGIVGSSHSTLTSYYSRTPRSYASYWSQLTRTTESVVGTGANTTSQPTVTTYSYLTYSPGKTTQPVVVARQIGVGLQSITKTKYCGQYALNSTGSSVGLSGVAARGLAELVRYNLVGVPVEHQTWVCTTVGTQKDSVIVGGEVTHFANLRPSRIFALATAKPIPAANFISSSIGTQDHTFHQDPHYIERVAFPLYSPWGNLRQQRVAQSPPTSYLWGYEETKPLAEVKNAAYATVAFTSFEEDAMGRFSYNLFTTQHLVLGGRTGRWAYRLNGSEGVSRDSLAAGDYELLFWAQSATCPTVYNNGNILTNQLVAQAPNGWYQYRLRLRFASIGYVNLDVSAQDASAGKSMLIDEVRLHPVGARMTSYTYDPLVGPTSQTDPSGRTLTYEYDALGRLVRTRDEQGRLLSQQEYHYARPQ